MKNSSLLFCVYIAILCFISVGAQDKKNDLQASYNQWPMSGGPNGNYKVKTKEDFPLNWSVRTGENIKWKKQLPEGGQSGIAVWGNSLFLTINPPNKNPKHADVLKAYKKEKKKYDSLFKFAQNQLKLDKDTQYFKLQKHLAEPLQSWKDLLANNANYQHASDLERPEIEKNLMKKNSVGQLYSKMLNDCNTYVVKQSSKLGMSFNRLKKIEIEKTGGAKSKDIVLLCIDANTGENLWSKTVAGTFISQYNYGFSDATTPCPMTDGQNVWTINASGGMACFSMEGKLIWQRTWQPSSGGKPFNKQFDSVLFEDMILNVEPPEKGDNERNKEWNYVHAFDKRTGKRLWVSKDAITHYNTPILGTTKKGKPALLIGRGGPHGVPERPIGLSLISLEKNNAGNTLWSWQPQEENAIAGWGALSTQHWNNGKASWFYKANEHLTVNTETGKLISKKGLNLVHQYNFNINTDSYTKLENVKIKETLNQWHCNILDKEYLFYMVRYSPYIARHNVVTGLNEHLEVPRDLGISNNYIWKIPHTNNGLNAKGQLNAFDARTRGNGFQKCFLGSPTMINNYLFFTNAVGMVYVLDTTAKTFNETALIAVNDLGESGETWTVNSMSYANGKIYHRTMKELICIAY